MTDAREVLTWSDFGVASRDLATQIVADGFIADIVVAVARGGLVPAGALAYALGTKAAGTLNVEFYTDVEETLPAPVVLEPLLDTSALAGKNLLVVDDVADSGRTLALVLDLLAPHAGQSAQLSSTPSRGRSSGPTTPGGTPSCGSRSRGRRNRRSPAAVRLASSRSYSAPLAGWPTGRGTSRVTATGRSSNPSRAAFSRATGSP